MLMKLLNLPPNTQMTIIYKDTEVGDEQPLTFHGITQDNDIVDVHIGKRDRWLTACDPMRSYVEWKPLASSIDAGSHLNFT